MTKKVISAVSLIALASAAHASVALTFQAGTLRDSGGSAITNGSKIGILIDTNGDQGFLTSTGTFDGRTFGAADVGTIYGGDTLLGVFDSQDLSGGIFGLNGALNDTYVEGTHLAIVWLSGYTNGTTNIAVGQEYGVYQNIIADGVSGGDQGLIIPADSSSSTIAYFDQNVNPGSSATALDFSATNTVTPVPEPSSIALLALGSVALLLRRSR